MDENDGPSVLVFLGIVSVLVGFLVGGWFWINVAYFGIGLVISGIIYKLADRDLTEGAFFSALLFGFFGAVLWIVVDTSRDGNRFNSNRYTNPQTYYKRVAQGGFKCQNCMWFGKQGCPRSETLINAAPCTQFSNY